ncbi:MAG: hypothetical protein QXX08_10490 [Candidatus Bathyarchaeia archaeon]
MQISEKLRFYLSVLMQDTFAYHRDLDDIALHFNLSPGQGSIKDRCRQFANEIPDEAFHELATYVLNSTLPSFDPFAEKRLETKKLSFARALMLHGFDVTHSNGSWIVQPKFGPERLEETRKEVKTFLENLGFTEIQKSLDIAEEQFINESYSQSLWNARKALEDLFIKIAEKLKIQPKEFLSNFVKSESSRELIKKIDWYACKGHAVELSESEAIFGYHLMLSAIYYLLLLFKDIQSSTF